MSNLLRNLLVAGAFATVMMAPVRAADAPPAPTKDPKDMTADEAEDSGHCPVCKKESKPVYHFEYKDKEYHFATRECRKAFADNPEKFGAKGAVATAKKEPAKK
jgi:YHS domain-containing protein